MIRRLALARYEAESPDAWFYFKIFIKGVFLVTTIDAIIPYKRVNSVNTCIQPSAKNAIVCELETRPYSIICRLARSCL